jgi:hypothetical protein
LALKRHASGIDSSLAAGAALGALFALIEADARFSATRRFKAAISLR